MKGIILAGGLGTRLRPLTYEIPKPLIPVKKKPIINHLIEFFMRGGITSLAIAAHEDQKEDFLRWRKAWHGDLPFHKISLFFERERRGTFGALVQLQDWIGNNSFVVTNGDELKDFDLKKVIEFHRMHQPMGTIALVKAADAHEYMVPVLDGAVIKELRVKPKNPSSNFICSGVYILNPEIFASVDCNKKILITEQDVFPLLIQKRKLMAVPVKKSRWYDCGDFSRWQKAIHEW